MKKIFILAVTIATINCASADTYTMWGSNDVFRTGSPLETQWGYDITYYVTVPNPIPASSLYTVGVSGKAVNDYASIDPLTGVRVFVSDGAQTYISLGFGDGSTNFMAPASGVVNFDISGRPQGTCTAFGGNCTIPVTPQSINNVPVQSASVNLQISQGYLDSIFTTLFGGFGLLKDVSAQTIQR